MKKFGRLNPFLQVTVSGMRIRVRLDEGRITELLKGLDGHATTTAGLLNCIGDLATISFAPHMAGVLKPHSMSTQLYRISNHSCCNKSREAGVCSMMARNALRYLMK